MELKRNRVLLLMSLVFFWSLGFSQLEIDREKWEEQREDYDYSEEIEKPDEVNFQRSFDGFNINGASVLFKIVIFIVVLALLSFLIYHLILNNSRNKQDNGDLVIYNDLQQAEKNLLNADLSNMLEAFLKDKDYRSAIRALYLQVIQHLALNNHIKWEKQKTNFDYLMELENPNIVKEFSDTTFIFEQVWYGRENVSKSSVGRMIKSCDQLKKKLK